MRIFFLYLSGLAFLLTELSGLIQGIRVEQLLMRSIVAGGACFIVGSFFCSIVEAMNTSDAAKEHSEQNNPNLVQGQQAVVTEKSPGAQQSVAPSQVKDAARFVDSLIKK